MTCRHNRPVWLSGPHPRPEKEVCQCVPCVCGDHFSVRLSPVVSRGSGGGGSPSSRSAFQVASQQIRNGFSFRSSDIECIICVSSLDLSMPHPSRVPEARLGSLVDCLPDRWRGARGCSKRDLLMARHYGEYSSPVLAGSSTCVDAALHSIRHVKDEDASGDESRGEMYGIRGSCTLSLMTRLFCGREEKHDASRREGNVKNVNE